MASWTVRLLKASGSLRLITKEAVKQTLLQGIIVGRDESRGEHFSLMEPEPTRSPEGRQKASKGRFS